MAYSKTTQRADPVVVEIVRGALLSITDEMKSCLLRTAYSQIIYEGYDFTVGLFDTEGDTVSIGLGLPMFIHGLSETVKAIIERYREAPLSPGDMIITNDAYLTGSHLNHIVVTEPIFVDGELVAYASTMAHWQDIGGTMGIVNSDIFSEGLQLPIMKLMDRGVQNEELVELICMNNRFPGQAAGDLRAQIAAVKTGEERVRALAARYGGATVQAAIEVLYDHSEEIARSVVEAIPDGTYSASSFMDNDGISDKPIPIKVTVRVEGDQMTVDLSEVGAQVSGYFNSGITSGVGAAQVAFRCLTSAAVFPINEGTYRALTVVLPPGRVISATKPAAMFRWMTIPMTVIDTLFLALAPVIPDRVAAGHHADLCSRIIYGVDDRTGKFYLRNGGPIGGGWGAKFNSDGESGTICLNDGDTHGAPIEATERKLPVIVERYALRRDSGGPGRYRGGLGVEQRMRFLSTATHVDSGIERTRCAPWGLEGGKSAASNALRFVKDGREIESASGKISGETFARGDVFIVQSGGGGGYGDPLERRPELVASDVRAGYVSIEAARDDYGVVVSPDGSINQEATDRLRHSAEAHVDG